MQETKETPRVRLLTRRQVQERIPVARVTIYRWLDRKTFPQPVKLGNRLYWLESDIEKWIGKVAKVAAA